jgi:hypothetical protein
MTAVVLDFHNHPTANQRWSNMEQFHQLKALGLVPDLPPASFKADTSPCEYAPEWPFVAPEDDPA